MTYTELKDFLTKRMRMSHIYQPVMIRKLLVSNGEATDKEIAQMILQFDPSPIEYYQAITNNMVGRVLRNHQIVDKIGNKYELKTASLSAMEKEELISICEEKVQHYIERRQDAIWNHRRMNRNAIPGTVRYEVLRRAHSRCELCGISNDERPLK